MKMEEVHDCSKCCAYDYDNGHDTEEFHHPLELIGELVEVVKFKELSRSQKKESSRRMMNVSWPMQFILQELYLLFLKEMKSCQVE